MDRENYLGTKLKIALSRIVDMQRCFAKRYISKVSESKDSCMISRSALDLSQALRKLSDDTVIQIEMTKYFKATKEKL